MSIILILTKIPLMLSYGNTINIQNILQSNKLNQSDSWFINCLFYTIICTWKCIYRVKISLWLSSIFYKELKSQSRTKEVNKTKYYWDEIDFCKVHWTGFISLIMWLWELCSIIHSLENHQNISSHFVIIIIDIWIYYQVRMRFLSFLILIVFIFINSSLYSLVHCHIFVHR